MKDCKGKVLFSDPITVAFWAVITLLALIGQIIFLVYGFTIGPEKNSSVWELRFILGMGIGVFGLFILSTTYLLFYNLKYWAIDESGIINGNVFFKKRIGFDQIKKIKYDKEVVMFLFLKAWIKCVYLYDKNSNKKVRLPLDDRTKETIEKIKNNYEVEIVCPPNY